ncbi:MAG: hypothetical protein JKX85_01875, partial [Phycisphaeraceae bacterium]|nr:hypothetical protein [Phycisphaeraceae bacterium]
MKYIFSKNQSILEQTKAAGSCACGFQQELTASLPAAFKKTLMLVVFLILCLTMPTLAQENESITEPNWNALGQIAVMQGGRLKPLDTVARSNMLMICGKQTVKVKDKSMHALEWLMDVMCRPEIADTYRVFLIHDPDIQTLLQLGEEDKRWSFLELQPHLGKISEQANQARNVQSHQQNRYQRAVIQLYAHLTTYVRLKNSIAPEKSPNFGKELADLQAFTQWLIDNPTKIDTDVIKHLNILKEHYEQLASRSSIHFVPPNNDLPWQRIGEHLRHVLDGLPMDQSVPMFVLIRQSYQNGDWATINPLITDHLAREQQQLPKIRSEATFNRIALLYKAMPVYVLGLVLTLIAMMTKSRKLLTAGVLVVIGA